MRQCLFPKEGLGNWAFFCVFNENYLDDILLSKFKVVVFVFKRTEWHRRNALPKLYYPLYDD